MDYTDEEITKANEMLINLVTNGCYSSTCAKCPLRGAVLSDLCNKIDG